LILKQIEGMLPTDRTWISLVKCIS
jgi:hypothetical protein